MAMTIQEFVSDPARMMSYVMWLNDEVTKELLEMAKEYRHPAPLKNVDGNNALYQYGMVEGANTILMLLTKLDELAKQQAVADAMSAAPTYGAEQIIKEKYT